MFRICRSRSPSSRSTGASTSRASEARCSASSKGSRSPSVVEPSPPVGWSSEAGTKQPSLARASITDSTRLVEVVGDLDGLRGAAQLVGQLALGDVDPGLQLLDPARRPDHPAVVAEVLAQLAADRRHGVGEEVVAGGHVVAARGLGQRQGGHLAQVVERDAARAVARRPRRGRGRGASRSRCRAGSAPPRRSRWPGPG